jgi:nucleotide-binding universal stress UspA family protein
MVDQHSAAEYSLSVIVVGVDFSPSSERALEEAFRLAMAPDASIHLAHVASGTATDLVLDMLEGERRVDFDEAQRHLEGYGRSRAAAAGFPVARVHAHVRLGSPAHELVELANLVDADLVVVGTHGRTGLGRLLVGSVAEAAVKKARCPVLVVREKNHPSAGAAA